MSSLRFIFLLTLLLFISFFPLLSPSISLFPTTSDVPSHTCRSHVRLLDPPPFTHTLVYEFIHKTLAIHVHVYCLFDFGPMTLSTNISFPSKCCISIDKDISHFLYLLVDNVWWIIYMFNTIEKESERKRQKKRERKLIKISCTIHTYSCICKYVYMYIKNYINR